MSRDRDSGPLGFVSVHVEKVSSQKVSWVSLSNHAAGLTMRTDYPSPSMYLESSLVLNAPCAVSCASSIRPVLRHI